MARFRQCRETNRLLTLDEWEAKFGREIEKTHFVQGEIPEYHSPIDGKLITSKRERRLDLARSGSRPYEGREQEEKAAARHRAYEEAKSDRELTRTVERSFMQLPESTRRALAGGHLDY